jgi:DNA-binding beta-propeller fold protein YncE
MRYRPTLRVLLAGISFALVAGASTFTQEAKLTYRLIPNPIQLPEGVALGGVSGLDVDSKDNLFVLQRTSPYVMVYDRDGKFLRSWDGDFKTPHGLRIDKNGNVWIADMANHLVQKFTPEGKVLLSLGVKNKADADDRHFNKPADAVVGSEGDIYVADGYGNSRIAKFSSDGKFVKEWGRKGKADGEFNIPHAVAWDAAGKLYVGDRENARVQIFDRDGKHEGTWKDIGYPYGLYRRDDKTYLADGRSSEIRVLDAKGKVLTMWKSNQTTAEVPHWLAVDSRATIYVGFVTGKKLQKWTLESQ